MFAGSGLALLAASEYKRGMTISPNNYVAEERLAHCLDGQGKVAEAFLHDKRAFQLMPSGFGRTSELPWDCERLYKDPELAQIGLETFSQIDGGKGASASSAYLKGWFESELGKPREAIADLQKATRRDPDFLLAWEKIADLGGSGYLDSKATDAAILQTLRLSTSYSGNGLDRHYEDMRDLANAYRIEQKATEFPGEDAASPLFPLHSDYNRPPLGVNNRWFTSKPAKANPFMWEFLQSRDVTEIIQEGIGQIGDGP